MITQDVVLQQAAKLFTLAMSLRNLLQVRANIIGQLAIQSNGNVTKADLAQGYSPSLKVTIQNWTDDHPEAIDKEAAEEQILAAFEPFVQGREALLIPLSRIKFEDPGITVVSWAFRGSTVSIGEESAVESSTIVFQVVGPDSSKIRQLLIRLDNQPDGVFKVTSAGRREDLDRPSVRLGNS